MGEFFENFTTSVPHIVFTVLAAVVFLAFLGFAITFLVLKKRIRKGQDIALMIVNWVFVVGALFFLFIFIFGAFTQDAFLSFESAYSYSEYYPYDLISYDLLISVGVQTIVIAGGGAFLAVLTSWVGFLFVLLALLSLLFCAIVHLIKTRVETAEEIAIRKNLPIAKRKDGTPVWKKPIAPLSSSKKGKEKDKTRQKEKVKDKTKTKETNKESVIVLGENKAEQTDADKISAELEKALEEPAPQKYITPSPDNGSEVQYNYGPTAAYGKTVEANQEKLAALMNKLTPKEVSYSQDEPAILSNEMSENVKDKEITDDRESLATQTILPFEGLKEQVFDEVRLFAEDTMTRPITPLKGQTNFLEDMEEVPLGYVSTNDEKNEDIMEEAVEAEEDRSVGAGIAANTVYRPQKIEEEIPPTAVFIGKDSVMSKYTRKSVRPAGYIPAIRILSKAPAKKEEEPKKATSAKKAYAEKEKAAVSAKKPSAKKSTAAKKPTTAIKATAVKKPTASTKAAAAKKPTSPKETVKKATAKEKEPVPKATEKPKPTIKKITKNNATNVFSQYIQEKKDKQL